MVGWLDWGLKIMTVLLIPCSGIYSYILSSYILILE